MLMRLMPHCRFAFVLAFAGLLPACDCGDDGRKSADAGPEGGDVVPEAGPDGGPDGGDFDGGILGSPCEPGDPCNDNVPCTQDSCDEVAGGDDEWRCRNVPNDIPCGDGISCNGEEVCDRRQGCIAGPPLSCNDLDVCTIDSCDEELPEPCLHAPRDFDADGHADEHCKGGDDCDDGNARVFEGAPEICGDGFDNDCNGLGEGLIDEVGCLPPGYDFCSGALDVSGGGVFEVDLGGTFRDYSTSCGFGNNRDAALVFTLDAPMDVDVQAEVGFTLSTVALGDDCVDDLVADPATHEFDELECNWGWPGRVRRRNLPAGTYYVIVAANVDEIAVVRVTFSDPTPAPTNEACDAPIDVSAGGEWEASFVDVIDHYPTTCGFSDAELVYEFTTDAPQDVIVAATSDDGRSLSVSVRSVCDNQGTEIRCTYSAPADFRLYSLAAGTYYLLVESGSENAMTLEVSFEPPSDPPPGDTCDDPIDVSAGGIFSGDLGDMQDDHDTRCGFHYRETVYELTLDEVKDVFLESTSTTYTYLSVRTDCDDRDTERRCVYGDPARATFRSLAAGTYYILVESFQRVDYDLSVTIADPVPIVDVATNDTCTGDEYEIPVLAGGVFRGNTEGMAADYTATCGFNAGSPDATYRFELDARTHVEASLEGSSYNTVLHLHTGTCNPPDQLACNDNNLGSESFIAMDLDDGTYFLVVDGFGAASDGDYLLDVTFEDL